MSTLLRIEAELDAALKGVGLFEAPPARHPQLRKSNARLRREARGRYRRAYPRQFKQGVEVHHRVPLEWSRRVFPTADPNRLANLQGLKSRDHLVKASRMWDAFRNTYRRLGRNPTQAEVLEFARFVDLSISQPENLDRTREFLKRLQRGGPRRLREFELEAPGSNGELEDESEF